jgi:hypothetical protein
MSSFVRFVLKHKHDDTPYGDLARDMIADPNIRRTWGVKTTKAYIEPLASVKVWAVLEELVEMYKRKINGLYK